MVINTFSSGLSGCVSVVAGQEKSLLLLDLNCQREREESEKEVGRKFKLNSCVGRGSESIYKISRVPEKIRKEK